MIDILGKSKLPEDLKKFLSTKFDCERESCSGLNYYACLSRSGILNDKASITNKNTPCFNVDCEQGSDINMAFERVCTQVGISPNKAHEYIKTARIKAKTNGSSSVEERKELIKKIEEEAKEAKEAKMAKEDRPTCSYDGCNKKLRKDSIGGRCLKHREGSTKDPDRPKRKYTKKTNKNDKPKKRSKVDGDMITMNDFIKQLKTTETSLGYAISNVEKLREMAEKMGPMIPESEILDHIKERLSAR